MLPGAKLASAKVVHDKELGTLEARPICMHARRSHGSAQELTFTPKKGNTQKILVWVLTNPSTHDTKAKAVARTWGPLCVERRQATCMTDWDAGRTCCCS